MKNKDTESVLNSFKKYIMINGKCNIYQTDRGTEFCNAITDSYCINEEIEHITSNVRHPQTNGSIEVVHKKLQTK